MDINIIFDAMNKQRASDVVLKVGNPPCLRVNGDLVSIAGDKLTPEDCDTYLKMLLNESQYNRFKNELELDFAYSLEGVCRLRGNAFVQRGSVGVVLRRIPNQIPTPDQIGLPEIAKQFMMYPRGLIVVTGPAGSGKTTSQASMVNYRNENEDGHIITIEDPIEYIHTDKRSLINQRQVGTDTESFARALKSVLRQDPDVILVGEMRDLETIALTVTASETGHLAIGTLHTASALQTVDRMIDVFPAHSQQQIRMQLAVNLIGVISQTLCRKADGKGRVAAFEVMVGSTAVRNLIREGKTFQLAQALETGMSQGMITLNRSLLQLLDKGLITQEEAIAKSTNPSELKTLLKEGAQV